MKLFYSYLKQHKFGIGAFFLFVLIFLFVFSVYKITLKAVIYPALVCTFFGAVFIYFDYKGFCKKHKQLNELSSFTENLSERLPKADTVYDEDYQALINLLIDEERHRCTEMDIKYSDMADYYTAWVHQIKTPIASMKLTLQNASGEDAKALSEELFKIEQYVEMVLVFLRLDSDYTDYVIKKYELDNIVKAAVKRFSGQFIRRKISLDYKPLNTTVLTDEKWLSFVIEQVISNALKYTPFGSVSIYVENSKTLCIKDTGIGIAPEDLPRIFDKGFTGYNGREDKKASGIGLYLCKRICTNLNHIITACAPVGGGTIIKIDLSSADLGVE